MAKTVNFATINDNALNIISCYHVAHIELNRLQEEYRNAQKDINKKITDTLAKREEEIKKNSSDRDKIIAKYDIAPLNRDLNALKEKYKEDCAPFKKNQKDCLDLIDDSIYNAYVLATRKGDFSASGNLLLDASKKNDVIKVTKSYKKCIYDFCVSIGIGKADNDTALNKFCQLMMVRCSGVRKASNKDSHYILEKKESQFKDIFMLSFLEHLIIEKGCIVVNENGSLSRKNYDSEKSEKKTA